MRLKNKILSKLKLGNVSKNISWILLQNVYTMILSLILTGLVARHYDTTGYGIINFALSYVSLFSFIAIFGTNHIILKDLTESKYDNGVVLGSNLFIRIVLSIIALIISQSISLFIYDTNTNIAILLFNINTVLCCSDIITYYAQSKIQNKFISISKIVSMTVFSILRIIAIVFNFNIMLYISLYLVETIIYTIMLIWAYKKIRSEKINWKINRDYLFVLLNKSKYYALAALMVTIYMKIDQVMIGTIFSSKSEVGIYSAAVRIAEIWTFVPLSVITSYKPIIIDSKEKNNGNYYPNLKKLYSIVSAICFVFSIFVIALGKLGIHILYGENFNGAYIPLIIIVFGIWIGVLGNIHYLWMTCENKEKYSLFYSFCGCISNIILNSILIPKCGIIGAAIATLISQIFSNVIAFLFVKNARILSIMLVKSLNPLTGFKMIFENFKQKSKIQ